VPSAERRSTLAKYVALQVPGAFFVGSGLLAAVSLFEFSVPLAALIFLLWIAKDAAMYPIVRVAYEPSNPDATIHMIGQLGTVLSRIDPEGWVRIGSERWQARKSGETPPIEAGAAVRVVAVRGLTLEVEPD